MSTSTTPTRQHGDMREGPDSGGVPSDGASSSQTLVPELNEAERSQASKRSSISAVVVHEVVRDEGERELTRHPSALAWSALAAGLSMGFSLVGQGLLRAHLPATPWRPLVASLGYTLGFLIVVLGRQQLFTENTVTAILPLLAHPNRETVLRVARLWGIVLAANLAGGYLFAALVSHVAVFPPDVNAAFAAIGRDATRSGFGLTLIHAIFAGWLIALMVWLLPAAEASRVQVIIIITYVVALGSFTHIIAGSIDVMYLAQVGGISWAGFLGSFFIPTLLGNIIGGTALVAALNFAQVASERLGEG